MSGDIFSMNPGQPAFTPGAVLSNSQVAGIVSDLPKAAPSLAAPPVVAEKTVELDKEPEEKAGSETIKMCPSCGVLLSEENEIKPTELEKDRWLRHILGEPRFEQTFTLFGGRLAVTFRSRTTVENDIIFNQLTEEVRSGEIAEFAGVMSPAYFTRMGRLMLTYSLVSLETFEGSVGKLTSYPVVTEATYPATVMDKRLPLLRAHDIVTVERSEGQLSAILVAHRRFEALIQTFMRHSDDPDFWRPIGTDT